MLSFGPPRGPVAGRRPGKYAGGLFAITNITGFGVPLAGRKSQHREPDVIRAPRTPPPEIPVTLRFSGARSSAGLMRVFCQRRSLRPSLSSYELITIFTFAARHGVRFYFNFFGNFIFQTRTSVSINNWRTCNDRR